MSDKKENFWSEVNEVLKSWSNNRTSDDIVIVKADDGGGGGESTPHGASAQITQANKVAARANSSAKTPTSSRATAEHAHKPLGSDVKPRSQLKPVAQVKPMKPVTPVGFTKPVGFVPRQKILKND